MFEGEISTTTPHLNNEYKAGLPGDVRVPGLQPGDGDPPGGEVPALHVLHDAVLLELLGIVRACRCKLTNWLMN